MQAVLRDRFGLVLREETHELPVYALVQTKSGAKLAVHAAGDPRAFFYSTRPGQLEGTGATSSMLAGMLSRELGHPVNDETGLSGQYDFKLDWTPDAELADGSNNAAAGPSIFAALTDQLGLRLESKKGPVQVYVIEKKSNIRPKTDMERRCQAFQGPGLFFGKYGPSKSRIVNHGFGSL